MNAHPDFIARAAEEDYRAKLAELFNEALHDDSGDCPHERFRMLFLIRPGMFNPEGVSTAFAREQQEAMTDWLMVNRYTRKGRMVGLGIYSRDQHEQAYLHI